MSQQIRRLISAVVLAPEAAAEAAAIAISRASGEPQREMAIAIEEAWWAMRAKGRGPYELQPYLIDGDPVMALTVYERTLLALSLRIRLGRDEIAQLLGLRAKAAARRVLLARRELARAAIAMTLLTNESRCPVLQARQAELQLLERKTALQIVTHAAECQVCVPYLRTVDRRIVEDYERAADDFAELPSAPSTAELQQLMADRRLPWWERLPAEKSLLKAAAVAGAVSSLALITALFWLR